jgi:hypothetical protein
VHHCGVFDLFAESPRFARDREASEPGPTTAKRPRRNSHLKAADRIDDTFDGVSPTIETFPESGEVSFVVA